MIYVKLITLNLNLLKVIVCGILCQYSFFIHFLPFYYYNFFFLNFGSSNSVSAAIFVQNIASKHSKPITTGLSNIY